MTTIESRLTDTLAALERDEKPPCIYCGASYQGSQTYKDCIIEGADYSVTLHKWHCGTFTAGVSWTCGTACYEHQLNGLRSEIAALREELDALHAGGEDTEQPQAGRGRC